MTEPKDFLTFAQRLLAAENPPEFDCRMAAARAYYGVMLLVRDHLGVSREKSAGGTHEVVRTAMYEVPPTETPRFLQLAKGHWSTLKDRRIEADYDLDVQFTKAIAWESVTRATRIFDAYPSEKSATSSAPAN